MITITEKAANHIKEMDIIGISIDVVPSGCNGFSYNIEELSELPDHYYTDMDVVMYVKPGAEVYLHGSVIDYVDDGFSSRLVIDNPNVVGHCGCGESFNV